MRKLWHGGTRLEIGLAVEVLRLDIADILVLRRRADDQIGWDTLVSMQTNKVADAQVLPVLLDPRRSAVLVAAERGRVRQRRVPRRRPGLQLDSRLSGRVGRTRNDLDVLRIIGVVVAFKAGVALGHRGFVAGAGLGYGAGARAAALPIALARRLRPDRCRSGTRSLHRPPAGRNLRRLDIGEAVLVVRAAAGQALVRGELLVRLLLLLLGLLLERLSAAGLAQQPLPPEALPLRQFAVFRLALLGLGLADELLAVEPVPDELGHAKAATLGQRHVRVVEGAAERDDLDVVDGAVGLVTLQVLVAVLEGGDEEDDDERQSGETRADGCEAREELEDDEGWQGANRVRRAGSELDGEEWRHVPKKKRLATRRNCSSRFLGRNVKMLYLLVSTWFETNVHPAAGTTLVPSPRGSFRTTSPLSSLIFRLNPGTGTFGPVVNASGGTGTLTRTSRGYGFLYGRAKILVRSKSPMRPNHRVKAFLGPGRGTGLAGISMRAGAGPDGAATSSLSSRRW